MERNIHVKSVDAIKRYSAITISSFNKFDCHVTNHFYFKYPFQIYQTYTLHIGEMLNTHYSFVYLLNWHQFYHSI